MRIVVPSLIILVGPSGSGKSTWAKDHFAAGELVSSDQLRAAVGLDAYDQRAGADAFAVLNEIVQRRLRRKLTTVIDTLGLTVAERQAWVASATATEIPSYAIVFDTDPKICRARNKQRAVPVPAKVLTSQIERMREVQKELATEGYSAVFAASSEVRIVNRSMAASGAASARQQAEPMTMDFGLQLAVFNFDGSPRATGSRLIEIAQEAERIGFTSLWVMDHVRQIPQVGPEWWDLPEAYTTLAFLAAATRRIKLGTLVTAAGYRNPALLGKMIATLDVLSGGRAIAGLGAGWFEREAAGYGWRFDPAVDRLDRLEDLLQLLPMLWGPGAPSFEGKTFSVPEAMCYPRPLQEHIAVLVGGGGEKRTLRLVAQYADMANLFGDPEVIRHKIEVLHGHCADVGRDPSEIEITHLAPALIAHDEAALAARVEQLRPRSTSAADFGAAVNAGTPQDHVGRLRALAEAGVRTAIISPVGLEDADGLRPWAAVIDTFSQPK